MPPDSERLAGTRNTAVVGADVIAAVACIARAVGRIAGADCTPGPVAARETVLVRHVVDRVLVVAKLVAVLVGRAG